MLRKGLQYGFGVLAAALVIAQFIQPDRTNSQADPSASFETVAKPPHEVAVVLGRACADCHGLKVRARLDRLVRGENPSLMTSAAG